VSQGLARVESAPLDSHFNGRGRTGRAPDAGAAIAQPAPVWIAAELATVRWTEASHESAAMNDAEKGAIVNTNRKERRGFASMSPEKQREIASKGGRAAHQKGTAHEWTSEEARSAGRKGGQISRGGRGRLVEAPSGGAEVGGDQAPGLREEFGG
jgi:uncharacterized protein